MLRAIRLVITLVVMLVATLILAPAQLVLRRFLPDYAGIIPRWWHRLFLALIGVRVHVHGAFSNAHPLLLVCNHISWMDILVMGSVHDLCFISKAEIGTWPIVSQLAKLQGTVFVDRNRSRDAANQADTIGARLLHGDVMVLFAEGTTGCGNNILPFKSSLFGAAQYAIRQSHIEMTMIQPVAITYTRLHGIPMGRRHQAQTSWPGEVELVPHFLNILRHAAYDVDVVLGHPLEFTATSNRKTIAKSTNQEVAQMFGMAKRNSLAPFTDQLKQQD